jgi:HSP20 family protein
MKSIHSAGGGRSLVQDSATHNRHNEFNTLMNYFWNYMDLPGSTTENMVTTTELEPKMQIAETKDAVKITAELPGIEEKDLDVQISSDGYLSLSGEKKNSCEHEEKDAYFSEISYGAFKRTIPLPWDLDFDKVNADFKNGILTVIVPKTQVEKQKFKKIAVNQHSSVTGEKTN